MRAPLAVLFSLLAISGCQTPAQLAYDSEVDRLCAIDGGVVVFEEVRLPANQFDQWGQYPLSSKEFAPPNAPYYYEREMKYLRSGQSYEAATLTRTEHKIIRRSDGKVLGKSIRYGRGGGDIPGPWHPSSYSCPAIASNTRSVEKQVFIPLKE